MSIRYDGKVAIVTGAGQGLGRSHAIELAKRGARVVVNDLGGAKDGTGGSSEAARAVVAEIQALGGEAIANGANVASYPEVEAMVGQAMEQWGRVDILVNNAGILRDKSFAKGSLEDFKLVLDVHLMGTVNCTKACWDIMREQSYGRVVVTTSSSGLYGNFGQANYGAAKMGVIGLMNTLVQEGAKYDIRVNALAPAEVAKVVLDEDAERIEVVVPDDQLSLAIGRRGQNVRLASQLTGWDIDILTEAEESERRQKEFQERTEIFMEALDVDEMIGQLLASEGFASVEEVAFVPDEEVAAIEGFDEDTALEIQTRAREYLERIENELTEKRVALGVEDSLVAIPGVTTPMLVAFGEHGIKTLEDLAGCATDDLTGWIERKGEETVREAGILDGFEISRQEAEDMIMRARVAAGWIEEEPETAPAEAGEGEDAEPEAEA